MTPNRSSDSCTTILVGKDASYDGSTIVARTEDSQNGVFTPKKFIVVQPEDQPRHYRSVLSPFEIERQSCSLHSSSGCHSKRWYLGRSRDQSLQCGHE